MFVRIFKRDFPMFLVSLSIGLLISLIPIILVSFNTSIYYPIEMWLYSQTILTMFYPLFCTIPFCWELLSERKSGFLKSILNRVSLNRYLIIRYLNSLLIVSLIIFVVSFVGAIFAEGILVPQHQTIFESHIGQYLWGDILVESPLLYAFFLSLWRIVLAGLYYTFAFLLVLFCQNSFIALTGPFIYSILENYFMSIVGSPADSMVTSFYITRLAPGYTAIHDLLVGPTILLVICILVFICGIIKFRQGDTRCLNIV